jgi:hypothetical protein
MGYKFLSEKEESMETKTELEKKSFDLLVSGLN